MMHNIIAVEKMENLIYEIVKEIEFVEDHDEIWKSEGGNWLMAITLRRKKLYNACQRMETGKKI
jgi:hypothetical protein